MLGVRARFRFIGELNDFLSSGNRHVEFEAVAGLTDNLKHVVESLGVPHTEVDRIEVNGAPADWSEALHGQDLVQVFPFAVPVHLENPRFVIDGHLGRLAAYLRMLGFDTSYEHSADDARLARIAATENRLLLTRDIGLLKRNEVRRGYWVRATQPREQLREICSRYDLLASMRLFTRCMVCNGQLTPVDKDKVAHRLPERILAAKAEFSQCTNCGRVFWKGSHYARMLGWIHELAAGTAPSGA